MTNTKHIIPNISNYAESKESMVWTSISVTVQLFWDQLSRPNGKIGSVQNFPQEGKLNMAENMEIYKIHIYIRCGAKIRKKFEIPAVRYCWQM